MERALQNTVIAKKYRLTLKSFFKDEFKYKKTCYEIPFSHVLYTKKQIFDYIRSSCSFICKKQTKCDGHQFLEFAELIYQYQLWCVKNKKIYFKHFYFYNFKLTSDIKMTLKPTKIKSWSMLPVDMEVISHLTYSQSLSIFKF